MTRAAALLLVALAACDDLNRFPGDMTFSTLEVRPNAIAVDATNLYWVNQNPGSALNNWDVRRVAKDDPYLAETVAHGSNVDGLFVDDSGLYWLDFDGTEGSVRGLPAGATAEVKLGASTNGFNGASLGRLVGDHDALYFADEMGSVWRVPKSGTGAQLFGTTDVLIGAIVLDGSGLWVTTSHGVKHLDASGTAAPELALAVDQPPSELFVDGPDLYAVFPGTGADDGSLVRVSTAGTLVPVLDHLTEPYEMISRDGQVYWASGNVGAGIHTAALAGGGDVTTLVETDTFGIAVDDGLVYWTESRAGQIHAIAR